MMTEQQDEIHEILFDAHGKIHNYMHRQPSEWWGSAAAGPCVDANHKVFEAMKLLFNQSSEKVEVA